MILIPLCYLWFLLWGTPPDKDAFAFLSTVEFGLEIFVFGMLFLSVLVDERSKQ